MKHPILACLLSSLALFSASDIYAAPTKIESVAYAESGKQPMLSIKTSRKARIKWHRESNSASGGKRLELVLQNAYSEVQRITEFPPPFLLRKIVVEGTAKALFITAFYDARLELEKFPVISANEIIATFKPLEPAPAPQPVSPPVVEVQKQAPAEPKSSNDQQQTISSQTEATPAPLSSKPPAPVDKPNAATPPVAPSAQEALTIKAALKAKDSAPADQLPGFVGVSPEQMMQDSKSGLFWQASVPPIQYLWQQAIEHCLALTYGGKTDWRLPTKQELATLAGKGQETCKASFPSLPCAIYWSASPADDAKTTAWFVNFSTAFVGNDSILGRAHVLCVRP